MEEGIKRLVRGGIQKKESNMTMDKIIECHKTMLTEFQAVQTCVASLPSHDQYDPKIVVAAAQAIVAAKIEEKHGVSSDDIERGVMEHHEKLGNDKSFIELNRKMQMTMQRLIGRM